LLQALNIAPGISQKQLAELLEIDSTTLTRTLAPLRKKNWLHSEAGADRRALRLSLTPAGKREYQRVLPYWRKAQKGLEKALGKEKLDQLIEAAVLAAGVNHIVLAPVAADETDDIGCLRRIADAVLPHIRPQNRPARH